MPQTGKCKNLKHEMEIKTDSEGRSFNTCKKCGTTPVIIKHETRNK